MTKGGQRRPHSRLQVGRPQRCNAPVLWPATARVEASYVPCVLEAGHRGDHRPVA